MTEIRNAFHSYVRHATVCCLPVLTVCLCLSIAEGADTGSTDSIDTDHESVSETASGYALISYMPEPIRGFNQGSFGFTKGVVDYGVKPLAKGWRFIIPEPGRKAIDRFGRNLGFPVRLVSLLLQGRPVCSAQETGHFLVNTTVGVVGLFDPAGKMGIPTYPEDVGQAFGRWGSGPGFYLFIPLLGPSSGRDGLGKIFDSALSPAMYIPGANLLFGCNTLSLHVDEYEALLASKRDMYFIARSGFQIQRLVDIDDYMIPVIDFVSGDADPTMLAVFAAPKNKEFVKERKVRRIRQPGTGKKVSYNLWLQPEGSRLLFIVPGIGAYRESIAVATLAESAYTAGMSVVAISNVFHADYLLTGLSHDLPGYVPEDASDIRQTLKAIYVDLLNEYGNRFDSVNLLGYSLGGMQSLAVADQISKLDVSILPLERIVVVNPPYDLFEAAQCFDRFYDIPLTWPIENRQDRATAAAKKTLLLLNRDEETIEMYKHYRKLPFERDESRFLVGLYGRDIIVAALEAAALRGAPQIVVPGGRKEFLNVISQTTFQRYADDLLLPDYLNEEIDGRTEEQLRANCTLPVVAGNMTDDPRVFVITNADDFVLGEQGLEWLEENLGERLKIFPTGGHLGNLGDPDMLASILEALNATPQP